MRVVLVVFCVGLVLADGPPKIAEWGGLADLETAASEESQWVPSFSEASRASEGLQWGSLAPKLASDRQSAASGRQETDPNPQLTVSSRQERYYSPQSATSSRQETHPNSQSSGHGDASHLTNPSGERKDVHTVTITKKVRVPYTVHVEKHIPKIIEVPVDKPFNVYVPKPYPVIVEKKVPYEIKVHQPQPYTVEKRVPYPVKVLVDKPYAVHVPKPYPVDVEKKYEFTVEKKIPYEVKVPVERPYPVHVIVEKEVQFPVEKKVPVPVKVPYEKPFPIHVTKHVPVDVDKPVPYTVDKVTTYPVKVPFRIPIKMHYPEGGSVKEVHGDVQNYEWAEAMHKATKAAKLESRPSQWHETSQGLYQWQGESKVPSQWHAQSQKLSQGQVASQKPSQWHVESQRPSQYHAELQRPSHWQELSQRPSQIRQGFSAGRGLPTRNGYFLGKHAYKRPTTKLQPLGPQYEVKEPQFEQPPTAPLLNRPGSEVIAPQMILVDSSPNVAGLQQPYYPNSGLYQSNSLSSGPQQSKFLTTSSHQSNPQNSGRTQPKYVSSGFQSNPSADTNSGSLQGSTPVGFSNSIPVRFGSPMLSNQHTPFADHQNNKNGTPLFSITNVIHHTGTPSQQSVVHHRAPYVLSGKPNRPQVTQLQYLSHNSLSTESAQQPSPTFFNPDQNNSTPPTYGTSTSQNGPLSTQPSSLTPFGNSGLTISSHSPPSVQLSPQTTSVSSHQLSPPQSLKSQQLVSPQLFNPTASPEPPQNNHHVPSSYISSKTVREGQELSYSTSIHHSQNSPTRPEQT